MKSVSVFAAKLKVKIPNKQKKKTVEREDMTKPYLNDYKVWRAQSAAQAQLYCIS